MRSIRTALTSFGVALSVSAVASPLAGAQTVYVDANLASGANDGSSWSDAYQGETGLQVALNASAAGEQIFVADGRYIPAAVGTRGVSFLMRTGVEIYGGFAGGEAHPDQRPPFGSSESILSGDLAGDDAGTANRAENSFHVVRTTGSNNTAILDGFTVTAGNSNGSGNNRDRGGGILCLGGDRPIIRNCDFVDNSCVFGGGAGYLNGSAPTFLNTQFRDNRGGIFGGAFDIATGGAIVFDGCVFTGNTAGRAGALEIFATTTTTVANCLFYNNVATSGTGGGGGLWIGSGGGTRVINCTVVGNSSTNQAAGGIRIQGAAAQIRNTIVWGNTGPGGAQNSSNQVTPGSNVQYSIVEGGFTGTGNLAVDPNFVDEMADDYRLAMGSPAIDAGNNAALLAFITRDADLARRRFDDPATTDTGAGGAPVVDMGPFEFTTNIGEVYCAANGNSTGSAGRIDATGSTVLADNDVTLVASNLPPGAFGFYLASRVRGFVANPAGSAGNLCLGGSIGRYVGPGQIQNSGMTGEFSLTIDLTALPQPTMSVAAQVGESWAFQAWHRDSVLGIPTSNFTDGVRIRFE